MEFITVKYDWKFVVASLIALAGAVVPVWISLSGGESTEISLMQVSSTSLQPGGASAIPDMEVLIQGKRIDRPFVTTFRIKNSGSKPIEKRAFDGPIEISVNGSSQIVMAKVAFAEPEDLSPSVEVGEGRARINPLLLNPGDLIAFSVISSGDDPVFSVRSRISGVGKINYQREPVAPINWPTVTLYSIAAFLNFVFYFVFAFSSGRGRVVTLGRVGAAAVAISSGLSSAILINRAAIGYGYELNFSEVYPVYIAFILIGGIVAALVIPRVSSTNSPSAANNSLKADGPDGPRP